MKKAPAGKTFGIMAWMVRFGLVVLIPAYLCWPVAAQKERTGAGRVINQVVDNWIAVAEKQCDRRLYAQAENSMLRVQQYQSYFSEQQKRSIEVLVEEIKQATFERTRLLQNVDKAGQLIEEGEFLRAKAYLDEATKSRVLNKEEKNRVELTLQRVEAKIAEQKRLMADLYKRSRREYKQGNFEKAREGFAIVAASGLYVPRMGRTAEEYLARIEQKPVERKNESEQKLWPSSAGSEKKMDVGLGSMTAVMPTEQQTPQMQQANQPVVPEGLGPERFGNELEQSLTDKGSIKQGYLQAVMRDAQTKVTEHIGKAEFSLAKAVVQNARNILQNFQADISEELYNQHSERLQELSRIIDQQQRRWELRWDTKDSGI